MFHEVECPECCVVWLGIDATVPFALCAQNFDDVLIPADHVSRSSNDTYYVDDETVGAY